MTKKCKPKEHVWRKLYRREYIDGKPYASWIEVKNKRVCAKCVKIATIK